MHYAEGVVQLLHCPENLTEEVLGEYLTFFSRAPEHLRRRAGMTVKTILTDSKVRVIPQSHESFMLGLDLYLARTNFKAQQTNEPADPNRPNNLWKPLPGDHGAHGPFDDRAKNFSWELWADQHRGWLLAAGAVGLLAGAGLGAGLIERQRRA